MKEFKILMCVCAIAALPLEAASTNPTTPPTPPFDVRNIRVLPFTGVDHELKPGTPGLWDVLSVSRSAEKVRILGTRRQSGLVVVDGTSFASAGKLALLPPNCLSGTLEMKDALGGKLFAVLALPDKKLSVTEYPPLKKRVKYGWSIEVEDDKTSLKITDPSGKVLNGGNGTPSQVLTGAAITGVGFACTLGGPGERVDFEFTFNAPR